MRYFSLQVLDMQEKTLFETDFLVDRFDAFTRQMAAALVRQGIFQVGEHYNVRILPRVNGNADFKKPVILRGNEIVNNGQSFLDVQFEQVAAPVDPVTYLTVQLRSTDANMAYRFDMPVDYSLGDLVTDVAQFLLDDGTLANGDHFRIRWSAHQEGRPKVDPIAVVKQPVVAAPPPKSSQPSGDGEITIDVGETIVQPAGGNDAVEIIIESVEELIKPEGKSMKAYSDIEPVGKVNDEDIPIFMRRGAMQIAHKSAHSSLTAQEEMGGFLIGNVFRDPDTERLFVEISEVVEADQAKGTYVRLDFTHEAWRQVLDRIDHEFPQKSTIGWYHTHLVSQASVFPVEGQDNEFIALYRTFFSQPDVFIHSNFFPDPWHVALVMDVRCRNEVFFAWNNGALASTRGFYLYGE